MQSRSPLGGPDLSGLGDDALLDVIRDATARLRANALAAATDDGQINESVRALQRCESAVHAEKLRRLHAVAERKSFLGDAERSAADWAASHLGLSQRDAQIQVKTAAAMDRLHETGALLASGDVTPAHAAAAARGLAVLDRHAAERCTQAGDDLDAWEAAVAESDRIAAAFDTLVTKEAPTSDPKTLSRSIEAWTITHTPEAVESRAQRAARRRGHWWDDTPDEDGLYGYRGRATAADKAQLTAAMGPLARKTSVDDDRSVAQRNLDALVDLARRACDSGDLPAVAAQRPHVILVRRDDQPDTPAWIDGIGPVDNATAQLVMCDADTTEFVVRADGTWDLGQADGDPTKAQRRAVIARDLACVGCGADASRCQLHHIIFRSKHGRTVIENLVLVCWSCHHGLHHLGWTITKDGGRYRIEKVATPR